MFGVLIIFGKKICKIFIEILFPEFCVGCNKLHTLLCSRCYETLEFLQFAVTVKEKCPNLASMTCCCYYDGLAKKIITELKYHSVLNVGKIIAHVIYYTCPFPSCTLITFVPLHIKKMKQRGFNQTQVIAEELSRLTNIPIAELLIKTKHTKSQMSLGQKLSRQKNILGTMSVNPRVSITDTAQFNSVLIIDDVFTSGTTIDYCAKILKDFGFKEVHGICFAHKN